MSVLVCGGAGYIGSHTVYELVAKGEKVVVADNLQKGHRSAVHPDAELCVGDLRDREFMRDLFRKHDISAVIDFAAESLVGESVVNPLKYYNNNVGGTINLLEAMNEAGVKVIVFSSTAATYGEPEKVPIVETDRTIPTNPYGETKLAVEKMLKWCDNAYGMKYVVLRYFNVAGAHVSGKIGEDHSPETHLIPLVLQTAAGVRESISVFGDDYPTADGTCVRDYIHVTDLADAHILALGKILNGGASSTYNLGNGAGFSIKQVIDVCRAVTGNKITTVQAPRRAGDPSTLVASSEKIISELKWAPKYDKLETIVETAWRWHRDHPEGFGD